MSSNYEDKARIKEKTKEKRTCMKKVRKEYKQESESLKSKALSKGSFLCLSWVIYFIYVYFLCLFTILCVYLLFSVSKYLRLFSVFIYYFLRLFIVLIYLRLFSVFIILCLSYVVHKEKKIAGSQTAAFSVYSPH